MRPHDFSKAQKIVASPEAKDCWIDLHDRISELSDRSLDELFERSRTLRLGAESIRVLSAEDHLALLAVHLLKHGAWRPLWLFDIGAVIESSSDEFDWHRCLGRDHRRAGWIIAAVGLAHTLLRAKLEGLPIAERAGKLPGWLVPAVLKQWQHPFATNQPPTKHPVPILSQLKQPGGLWRGLVDRWPDPILATVSVQALMGYAFLINWRIASSGSVNFYRVCPG